MYGMYVIYIEMILKVPKLTYNHFIFEIRLIYCMSEHDDKHVTRTG